MNVELRFLHAIAQGTFCMVIAPEHLCFLALEGFVREGGAGLLYICGNFSRILGRLDRCCPEFRVRRAFTAHQLLAILEEADCRLIVLEHDPTLYDDASDLALPVGLACADRARIASLVLLAARADPALQRMAQCAHRIVSVEQQEVPGRRARQLSPLVREQQTLDRAP